jgi:hypothetical protein
MVSVSALVLALSADVTPVAAPPTDRDRAELRGLVKSVTMRWQANHKDDYGSIEERQLGTTTYDEAGNLLVRQEITPDFSRKVTPERHGPGETLFRSMMGSSVQRYRFDAAGHMSERQTWYGEHANGAPSITERFKYDSAGRVTDDETLAGDGTGKRFDVRVYTRDAAGNVTVEEIRPADKEPPYPRMHYTYEFDAHGNWTAKLVRRENVAEDAYDYRYAGNLYRTITYFGR